MSKLDSTSLSRQQIAKTLRLTGWVGFWTQLVLAIVSSIILIFASFTNQSASSRSINPGTGTGLLLAICGLIVLYGSIYWAFRYTRVAKQLEAFGTETRPKRSETLRVIWVGAGGNLGGMLLTLLGAEAIVGGLLAKLSESQGDLTGLSRVQFLDILVVQANINTVLAQFVGIAAALWLLNRLSK